MLKKAIYRLDKIGKFLSSEDAEDVFAAVGYVLCLIGAISACVGSHIPFILDVILVVMITSIAGSIVSYLFSILRIILLILFIPISRLADILSEKDAYRLTLAYYIEKENEQKRRGIDTACHACYLHD